MVPTPWPSSRTPAARATRSGSRPRRSPASTSGGPARTWRPARRSSRPGPSSAPAISACCAVWAGKECPSCRLPSSVCSRPVTSWSKGAGRCSRARSATPTGAPSSPCCAGTASWPSTSASPATSRPRSSGAYADGVARCDAVLTSGGVSMGDFDLVKVVLDRIGRMHWMQVRRMVWAAWFGFPLRWHGRLATRLGRGPLGHISGIVSLTLVFHPVSHPPRQSDSRGARAARP